jgi:hypothetical protein
VAIFEPDFPEKVLQLPWFDQSKLLWLYEPQ